MRPCHHGWSISLHFHESIDLLGELLLDPRDEHGRQGWADLCLDDDFDVRGSLRWLVHNLHLGLGLWLESMRLRRLLVTEAYDTGTCGLRSTWRIWLLLDLAVFEQVRWWWIFGLAWLETWFFFFEILMALVLFPDIGHEFLVNPPHACCPNVFHEALVDPFSHGLVDLFRIEPIMWTHSCYA